MRRIPAPRLLAATAATFLLACSPPSPDADSPDAESATARAPAPAPVTATPPAAPSADPARWYHGVRALDLTGDGRADSVRLEAHGTRPDSLDVSLTLVVDGAARHRETWGSSYELALVDSTVRVGAGAGDVLRARLDSVLASVVVERLDAPSVRLEAEDSVALAALVPRPTHRISFSYGYETTTRLAWDAARERFVRLWSCC